MMQLAITDSKFIRGVSSLDQEAVNLDLERFDLVFDKRWTDDVHFVCYSVVEPGEDRPGTSPFPRLNKEVLPQIREAGGDVVLTCLTFDYDLKDQQLPDDHPIDDEGKPIWSKQLLELFEKQLENVDDELIGFDIKAPMVYTTTHGARFVHPLSKPVQVEEGEDLLRGVQRTYGQLGLNMDPLCDWTRLFRAPRVVRNGKQTGDAWWQFMRPHIGETDPDKVEGVSKAQDYRDRYAKIQRVTASQPTAEEVYRMLFDTAEDGRQSMTEMHKLAKRELKGTDCFGPCFEMAPLAEEGSRDQTLIRLVGQACAHLLHPRVSAERKFSARDIYSLFMSAVEQLDPDPGTPDWMRSLWQKVCRCFEKETAKRAAEATLKEEAKEVAMTRLEKMAARLRETCKLPELTCGDKLTENTALQRLLLIKEPNGRYRALTEDGYTDLAVPQNSLHHLIGQVAKISDLIPLWVEDDKGKMKPVPETQLTRMATDVRNISGASGVRHNHLTGTRWDSLTLRTRLYRRNPELIPSYSAEVDEWLTELTTKPQMLMKWLAYALDFEGGAICALSLAGAAGAGKGMLAQGLVETLEEPCRANKDVLVTNFNDSIMRTPFLIIDEGLPRGKKDITDEFRSLTAGDPIRVEEKFKSAIEVRNPLRILFLANNMDVVDQLAAHRVTDVEDQRAIARRLVHLDVPESAERHLRTRGGLNYTRGWVEAADGAPSEFVLAKHLLWMHENRDRWGSPGQRFLVEGSVQSRFVTHLRISSKVAQAVVCAIIEALESQTTNATVKAGISTDGARLRITSAAVARQHEQNLSSNVNLTPVVVGRTMRNLLSPGFSSQERDYATNLNGLTVRERWWDVDVRLVHDYAEGAGFSRTKLKMLCDAQYPREDFADE